MHVQDSKYQQVSNPKEGELYLLTPTKQDNLSDRFGL